MKIQIQVDGMTCRHCEMSVEKAIKQLPGVEEVHASHKEKKVEIIYNNPQLTKDDFYQAVEETGYIPIKD
jgi:copper ion binding protein